MTGIDCNSAIRLTHLKLDGDLPREDARLLQRHLESCEQCQRSSAELADVAEALRSGLASAPPPADVCRTRREVELSRMRRDLFSSWLPAVAAFILVAGAIHFFFSGRTATPVNVAPAVVVSGGEAVHVFEPNQNVSQPGRTGVELQEHTVAWGLSDAPIALRFASGAQVELSNEAVVRIGRDSLSLFKGDLRADLTETSESFTVATPWGEFAASGAIFHVHSDAEDSSAVVRVVSGEVRVEQQGWSRVIDAGGQLTLKPDPHRAIIL